MSVGWLLAGGRRRASGCGWSAGRRECGGCTEIREPGAYSLLVMRDMVEGEASVMSRAGGRSSVARALAHLVFGAGASAFILVKN